MRGVITILALSGLIAQTGEVRGQGVETSLWEGVVTLVDASRNLLVIQDGESARAIKLDGDPPVQLGERVRIEGQVNPWFAAFPEYPAHPAGEMNLAAFETPTDWKDHFIARLRGFLRVPADGDYTLWIAADDEGELLLGSNRDPATARLIAAASGGAWPLAWDDHPEKRSQPIHLKAGDSYYIEARQREWRGHDRLAVAWQSATLPREIISGQYLSPWRADGGATNGILYEYWTNCFITRLAGLTPEAQVFALNGAGVRSLGPGQLPAARRVSLDAARSEVGNFAWVEAEGTVSFAAVDDGVLTLELRESNGREKASGTRMIAHVLKSGERPAARWLNCKVRARGVREQVRDVSGEMASQILWVQDDRQIEWLGFGESDSRDLEVLPMFEITPANLKLAWGRKVMVRGTVTSYEEETGRVVLRGEDSFYAYSSTDGKTWSPFGAPVPVMMEDSIFSGLAAASITATQAVEATFTHIGPDLNGSRTAELGGGATKGSVTISNGTAAFRPAGNRDWITADGGTFLCQPLQGEGEIVARIETFNATRNSDKAGLMMRESLQGNAPFVALVMTHGDRLDFIYRSVRGSVTRAVQRESHPVPTWLKLVRRRHEIGAFFLRGEPLRRHEQVELVGWLNWTNGEPLLLDAYVRPAEKAPGPVRTGGAPQAVKIANLPSSPMEFEEHQNQEFLLSGVVTFKGRAFERELFFLQDESGAASLRAAPPIFRQDEIRTGRWLEVMGGVLFAPGRPPFRVGTATVLGSGRLPRPISYPDRSEAGLAEGHWVEAEGIVRSATTNVIRVMSRSGLLLVWIGDPDTAESLARYVDCRVTVRGVFSMQAASEPAILVPAPRFIEVTESPPEDPFLVPSHEINKVWSPEANAHLQHRVKVTGVITYRDDRMLVMQDQTGGARVFGAGAEEMRLGDRVEVVGFPLREGEAVTMRESVVRKVGDARLPEPIAMMMEGLLDGRLNCWLVRLDGFVLDQKSWQGQQLLELQNGQRVFQAVLADGAGQLKPLPAGSRVQVTGVTQLQIANDSSASETGGHTPLIATMDVLMRTPADLILLERPPWWTWQHTAIVGAVLVAILIAAVGWIRSLHRRVAQRTSELQVAMGRLQQETELSATLAERERLAAEIHDTLEQGLSGIMMQLDGADTRLVDDTSGARQNLEMARRMVRFSRAEVRHSLWNLESQLLKDGDLGAALREIARQMSAGSSTTVSVEVSEAQFALPPAVEHHLLRCTQEAISNALKHSGAPSIRVKLQYRADHVELEIADDGNGFDSSQVMTGPGTHLGLRNLRSRARKIKGQLDIASEPLKGTTVRLNVPLNSRVERTRVSTR